MNEDLLNDLPEDNSEDQEIPQEETQAITLQDFETFNMNYATGTLFTVGALGILSGALVASAFKGILRI